jgi:hypothetical protein
MLEALGLGLLAQSSLLLAGLVVWQEPRRSSASACRFRAVPPNPGCR